MNKKILKAPSLIIVGVALILFIGCMTRYPVHRNIFFHGSPPDFKPGPEGGVEQVDIKEGVDFTKYKMILMDPVEFRFQSAAKYNAINSRDLNELRKAFHSAIADALGDAYPIVDKMHPNAMRFRVMIDGIAPVVAGTSDHPPISVGGASMKAELLDSWTNERIAAVMDTKTGDERKTVKGTDQWEHTKDAFKFWAQRFRKWLDGIHGRT